VIAESDPSKMFKYDVESDRFVQSSLESCTFDGEMLNKVRCAHL